MVDQTETVEMPVEPEPVVQEPAELPNALCELPAISFPPVDPPPCVAMAAPEPESEPPPSESEHPTDQKEIGMNTYVVMLRHSKHPTGQFKVEAANEEAAKQIAKSEFPEGEICEVTTFDPRKKKVKPIKGGK